MRTQEGSTGGIFPQQPILALVKKVVGKMHIFLVPFKKLTQHSLGTEEKNEPHLWPPPH